MGRKENPPDPEQQGRSQHGQKGNAGRLQLPPRLINPDQFFFRKAFRAVIVIIVIV